MVDGRWSMVDGQWSMVDGRWSMVDGQWSMVDGRWWYGRDGVHAIFSRIYWERRLPAGQPSRASDSPLDS